MPATIWVPSLALGAGYVKRYLPIIADLANKAKHRRQDNAEFADLAANAVVERGAFFNKPLAGAVQAEHRLLVFVLDRDKAHVGSGDGFADRRIVLAALAREAVRRNELGCDQADRMALLTKQPCPMVRSGTGFHADQARRQLGDQVQQLLARHLGFDQFGLACFIHAMHGKDVLGEIDPNGDNGL